MGGFGFLFWESRIQGERGIGNFPFTEPGIGLGAYQGGEGDRQDDRDGAAQSLGYLQGDKVGIH